MKRLILGVVLAAVAWFIWGAVFWMGPWSSWAFSTVADDAAAGAALVETFGETGVYVVPGNTDDQAAWTERHRAGPVALVHVQVEGVEPMSPGVFLHGFLHMLASTLLIALVLRVVLPCLPSYGGRVTFLLLVGVAAAVASNLAKPIWWYQSWSFHTVHAIFDVTSWLVVALVLAAFVKPEEPAPV